MADTTRPPLITDSDLDCLDTLNVDNMTVAVSDLHVLAPRLRARWVADALDNVTIGLQNRADTEPGGRGARERVDTLIDAADLVRKLAAEYRAGTR